MRMTWHVYVFHQFVLGRMCPSGTQRTMKHQQASPGGSEIRLEAARPLADERVHKCVSVICWLLASVCVSTCFGEQGPRPLRYRWTIEEARALYDAGKTCLFE